jgi:hypothetical protein
MSLWKWLGLQGHEADEPDDGLDEIERALAGMDVQHARYVACFAYILTRAARADHEVTDAEMAEMQRLVAERGGIRPDEFLEEVDREVLRLGIAASRAGWIQSTYITPDTERWPPRPTRRSSARSRAMRRRPRGSTGSRCPSSSAASSTS